MENIIEILGDEDAVKIGLKNPDRIFRICKRLER